MGPPSGNSNNLTNLEHWALREVADFLWGAYRAIFKFFPKVTELFLVVPEYERRLVWDTHYGFNNGVYPKDGERGLLPWAEAIPW